MSRSIDDTRVNDGTLRAGIVGRSLKHSVSPELHAKLLPILNANAGLNYKAIDYQKFECDTELEVFDRIREAHIAGFAGLNVTMPYKTVVAEATQFASLEARRIHSANTIRFDKRIRASSTDGRGFLFALDKELTAKELPSMEPLPGNDRDLVIFGAGGAARAVLYSLLARTWRSVTVVVRDPQTSALIQKLMPAMAILTMDEFKRNERPALVINATPVGQASDTSSHPFKWRSDDIAIDLVYNPAKTTMLTEAKAKGAQSIGGLGMLIEQAALSQYHWLTGVQSQQSMLTSDEYQSLKATLTPLLTR